MKNNDKFERFLLDRIATLQEMETTAKNASSKIGIGNKLCAYKEVLASYADPGADIRNDVYESIEHSGRPVPPWPKEYIQGTIEKSQEEVWKMEIELHFIAAEVIRFKGREKFIKMKLQNKHRYQQTLRKMLNGDELNPLTRDSVG